MAGVMGAPTRTEYDKKLGRMAKNKATNQVGFFIEFLQLGTGKLRVEVGYGVVRAVFRLEWAAGQAG